MNTKHTPGLKLSARIENINNTHAQIGVFQNGGKAGVLTVDVEYADQIVRIIAAAPELLAACAGLMKLIGDNVLVRNIEDDVNPSWAIKCLPLVRTLAQARSAIALAEKGG